MSISPKVIAVVLLSILLAAAVLFVNLPKLTGDISQEPIKVKLATFAVCEQKEGYAHCKDKLFASCNNSLIELNNSFFYCNGTRYEVGNISLGEAYLNNFTDAGRKELITGWAISE